MCKKYFIGAFFALLLLSTAANVVQGQQPAPVYQDYGKVAQADLEMKACDFEKDANAEVLFDKGVIERGVLYRHVRIKIFNTAGVSHASMRITYINYVGYTGVSDFKGETINLDNNKIVVTPIDKKQVYTERTNRFFSTLAFAFPNAKAGSIIEYKLSMGPPVTWYFQSDIPTRYSEIEANFPPEARIKYIPHTTQPFFKSVGDANDIYQDKVLTNVNSLPDEPFMGARKDNLQRMEFINNQINTWVRIGELLMEYTDFGQQFNRSLKDEDAIIKQARSLGSVNEKISFIFNQVKNAMKWDDMTSFATVDGTSAAWDKRTGNSAEINLILYHLLKKSGIGAYPMVISTKSNGKINPFNPNPYSFNNTVVYIPTDPTNIEGPKYYVLDATNKFNLYNAVPKEDLNTFGLCIDKENDNSRPIFLENRDPILRTIFLTAEISAEGKMTGMAHISSSGYNRVDDLAAYKTLDETKYKARLTENDNNLKILSLKLDNTETDSLPLRQSINFTFDASGAGDGYIYFSPDIFLSPHTNPFLSETRYSDVDFGYHSQTSFSGIFKVPAGYKIDALPKNVSLIMPDTSVTFRRTADEQDGTIVVRYSIFYKKTIYFRDAYPDFYAFFKKMYELLNEQIVLKKG